MARTQRVQKLIENFMQYHNDGYPIIEIAEIFNVDFSTVYNNLQQIADLNGVSRESLLKQKKSTGYEHTPFYKERVDVKKLEESFDKVDNDIKEVIATIDEILLKTER